MKVIIICAMTKHRVIGKGNSLPWHIPQELAKFRSFTKGNTVVMGRRTFESIGSRPLPNRSTIVVSAKQVPVSGVIVVPTLDEAIARGREFGRDIFILGGAGIFKEALQKADCMYLSFIKKDYEGDTCFPKWDATQWKLVQEEMHEEFVFRVWGRKSQQ
ncbi:TPA: dihydrofolate reductase [Candidatus Woesearchaeota archaeon]|nr:dihydrofolate reductase [Candidatus Woesearchaeota archaeon]HII68436.1 dihydrofolate reductase [Candidatus Woesearchaeota archaeon]